MFLQRFIATNKIFQLSIKSFQCFWILFFPFRNVSRPCCIGTRTYSARAFKGAPELFPVGVFGTDLWSILEAVILLNNQGYRRLFMYFLCYRGRNKLNSIFCLAKRFKTMCSSYMTECTFVTWSITLMVGIGNAARIAWPILTLFCVSI